MKHLVLVLILINSLEAHSAWYCNQVASEWTENGKTLSACGVGYGKDENEARLDAFENAKMEFKNVCGKETSCAGRRVNIEPQRSECSPTEEGFTCRRLFNFLVTDVTMEIEATPIVVAPVAPAVPSKTEINNFNNSYTIINQPTKVIKQDGKDFKFKRFVRSVGSVSIYETNYRGHQGIILTNPADYEIEQAIKRASKTGSMNQIYIMRN